MIKVGIVGADSPMAGELLRILVRHPEVDVRTLFAPALSGRKVSSCHHGFIGEEIVSFSDKISPASLDVIFLADNSKVASDIISRLDEWPDLRLIDLSPKRIENRDANGMDVGLSEANRKCLVRGSRIASIPSAPSALTLISLNPLALNLLLPEKIDILVEVPPHMPEKYESDSISKEISSFLSGIQSSFTGNLAVKIQHSELFRSMKVKCRLKCALSADEIVRIFESVYDDHNFTFITRNDIEPIEIEGTQKCVISIVKPDSETLELKTIADAHMRGGAGDAVHVMNLLFALQEKVGLDLKPARFGGEKTDGSIQTSWFA